MSENGKGSKRRPKSVDQKTWADNYDRIFRKKEQQNVDRRKSSN
jgi:hypothetical protein